MRIFDVLPDKIELALLAGRKPETAAGVPYAS